MVSYDRLIENAEVDCYVSFDNEHVGELQAESLSEKLKEDGSPSGPIVMINGDPADRNAAQFKAGAHNGFDKAGVEIAKEYDTPEWSATNAQNEMQQAITALGNNGFAGVYAANDDTGGRRDRGDEGRRDQPRRKARAPARTRPSRRAADPRRPAVHDRLQGDRRRETQSSRRNRRRAGGRRRTAGR